MLLLVFDGVLSGVGEVGLPPKKKDCYEADVQDIACYVQEYFSILNISKDFNDDVFSDLQQKYFETARREKEHFSSMHY